MGVGVWKQKQPRAVKHPLLLYLYFSFSLLRQGLEPHTQDPAAFAPSTGVRELTRPCLSVLCGCYRSTLGPPIYAASTSPWATPGLSQLLHHHISTSNICSSLNLPVLFIYLTKSNLSPIIWYLLIIQSDIRKFTISISHLQSWICIWIVIGKIANIIFMWKVHSECNCIVGLSLLPTCSNWTSWEVISAIKKHKALYFPCIDVLILLG